MSPSKLTAALAIFDAIHPETQHKCLNDYWDLFFPYFLPAPCDHENDWAEWVDNRFEQLYRAATQWLIIDLLARVEHLESPDGGDAL